MASALEKYKSLVDKLRNLPVGSSESQVSQIDAELQEAWDALGEHDKMEAESYWRSSASILTKEFN